MAQRHRKSYVIQTFGIPAALQAAMRAAVEQQQRNTRDVPLNVSSWICRAIERDLAHAARSRSGRVTPVGADSQIG
jgi:hypothetical protein